MFITEVSGELFLGTFSLYINFKCIEVCSYRMYSLLYLPVCIAVYYYYYYFLVRAYVKIFFGGTGTIIRTRLQTQKMSDGSNPSFPSLSEHI